MTTFNYESDFSAVGDMQRPVVTLTIDLASPRVVKTVEAVFQSPRDVGKVIAIPGGFAAGIQLRTILSVDSTTQITVGVGPQGGAIDLPFAYTASAQILMWGTDNAAHMAAFVAAHPSGTHTLQLTAGHEYFHSYMNAAFSGTTYTQLTIAGNASSKPVLGLGIGSWGGDGEYPDYLHSARTKDAKPGDTHVDLVTPSQISRFVTGNYFTQTGFVLQIGGYPTNHAYVEHRLITNRDTDTNSATYGRISFATPLVNTYLSSWPYYGDISTMDDGGPATAYAAPPSYNAQFILADLKVVTQSQQTAWARSVHLNNVDQIGVVNANNGVFPTYCDDWQHNGGDCTNITLEVDKATTSAIFNGITNLQQLFIQSMSVQKVKFLNSTSTQILGLARSFLMDNDSVVGTLTTGLGGPYGSNDEAVLNNSTITALVPGNGRWSSGFSGAAGVDKIPGVSLANGLLKIPKTEGPISWAYPGNTVLWTDDGTLWSQTAVRVVSCADDGTNTVIALDPPLSGFLPLPFNTGTNIQIYFHPGKRITCSNMSGDKIFEGLNVARARAPLGSYHKATYLMSAALNTTQRAPFLIGNLKSAKYTVNHAYGGSGALSFPALSNMPYLDRNNSHGISPFHTPTLDMKTAGLRSVTAAGVTGSGGADSGLAMPDTVQTWLTGTPASAMGYSADKSGVDGAVSLTVEIQTDQYKVEIPLLADLS